MYIIFKTHMEYLQKLTTNLKIYRFFREDLHQFFQMGLEIQCNIYLITSQVFSRTWQAYSKICTKIKRQNSQHTKT